MLYIGLMTDADDQGLFEWKPLQIKMRLLPADHADIPALLQELIAANLIADLETEGKKLGAIRYFRRFQRPKKPNAIFPLPAAWAPYVGLTATGSDLDGEPVPNRFPTGGEKSPQMEDGGWRREEEVSVDKSTSPDPLGKAKGRASPKLPTPSPLQSFVDTIWAVAPKVSRQRSGRPKITKALAAATERGHDPAAIVAGFCGWAKSDDATREDGKYAMAADRMIRDGIWDSFIDAAAPIIDPADLTDADWARRLNHHAAGRWLPDWGPAPGKPGCLVPSRLLLAAAA